MCACGRALFCCRKLDSVRLYRCLSFILLPSIPLQHYSDETHVRMHPAFVSLSYRYPERGTPIQRASTNQPKRAQHPISIIPKHRQVIPVHTPSKQDLHRLEFIHPASSSLSHTQTRHKARRSLSCFSLVILHTSPPRLSTYESRQPHNPGGCVCVSFPLNFLGVIVIILVLLCCCCCWPTASPRNAHFCSSIIRLCCCCCCC